VLTPFFFGTVAGGIASGRVQAAGGDPLGSWLNPTSLLGGTLAVVACAYLAAVFLAAEARARRTTDLEAAFRRRARLSGLAAGALALGGVFVLRADSRRLFDRLVGPALPLVLLSALCGVATLLLIGRADPTRLRVLAVVAVAAVVSGWGVAQYPELLGTHLPIASGAAPGATLASVVVIFGAATVLVLPSLGLLYLLQQRGRLEE
jgi:cytochrome d ubiquinol oxidase subunit II